MASVRQTIGCCLVILAAAGGEATSQQRDEIPILEDRVEVRRVHLPVYLIPEKPGECDGVTAGSVKITEGTGEFMEFHIYTYVDGSEPDFAAFDLTSDHRTNRAMSRDAVLRKLRRIREPERAMALEELVALSYGPDTWNPDGAGPATQRNYAAAGALTDFPAQGVSPARVLNPDEIRSLEPAWFAHWRLLREAAAGLPR